METLGKRLKNIVERKLDEERSVKYIVSKYKKQGWSVYMSKAKHRSESDYRLEFEKDEKEFEVIGIPGRWEIFKGPTMSGRGKEEDNLEKAIAAGIKMNK